MILLLGTALFIGVFACRALIRAEREDRPEVAVGALVVAILVEAVLYQSEHLVPRGIFRPAFAGQSFRLPEIVIGAALTCRVLVHGGPRRLSPPALAWTLFLVWYALQAVLGRLLGNPLSDVLFQVKAVVYLGGAIALVSAVPARRLVSADVLRRVAIGFGGVVAVLIPLSLASRSFALSLPGAQISQLGRIGADSASIFVVAGVLIGVVELARTRPRNLVLAATLPLLAAPFAITQRGAVVGLAASGAVLAYAATTRTWHVRNLPTASQMGLAVLGLLALGSLSFLQDADEPDAVDPVTAFYDDAFESTGKQQSAQTRLFLWDEAHRLWQERPVLGAGLGKQFTIKRAATQEDWVAGGFHNLGYDLLVRSGVVGLVLFTVAMGLSLRDGLRAWREHLDHRIAALALAAMAAAAGLLAKGMVESVLEKAKLATLLGVCVGIMLTAWRSTREREQVAEDGADLAVAARPIGR